jgi:uncharacterized protein
MQTRLPLPSSPGELKAILSRKTILLLFLMMAIHVAYAQPAISQKTKDLFKAIRSGSNSELEAQLKYGADANDSLDGYSALMGAALSGSTDQMKILIDHGANVNFIAQSGISALWLAAPDWDKTKLLLDKGANAKHTVRGYGLLVKIAAMPGTLNIANLLIEKGADPKQAAPDNSLVYNAAASGDTSILGFYLRNGFKANDTLSYGDYPISGALFYRNSATVKMLIDNGADVNIHSKSFQLVSFNGFTPLMYAALNNDKSSFYYLLNHGADPNRKNENGYTALILLQQADEDDPAMTKALLEHGAEPAIRTPSGNDALHFAMQKGNTESVAILKKYAAK